MSDNINLLKNYLLYLLVGSLICMVGISNVFAESYTYEDIGYFTNQSQVQVEVNYTAQPLTIALNQHVQLEQVFSLDIFVNNLNLSHDYIYYFEIYLPSTVLTRANMAQVTWYGDNSATGNCTIVSTYFSNNYPHVTFKCNGSTNIKSLYIRYYNSSNQYLFDAQQFYWNYTFMRRRTPSSTDNTGEIKDALNQQTEDIINNQNYNTDKIINVFENCRDSVNLFNNVFRQGNVNGNTSVSTQIFADSNYSITSNTDYTISTNIDTSIYQYQIFINNNTFPKLNTDSEEYTSGWKTSSKFSFNVNVNGYFGLGVSRIDGGNISPSDIQNFWFQLQKGNTATSYEPYGEQICINKLDNQTNAINGLNDSIKDDDIGDSTEEMADFITDFDTDTFGLTSIITAPLNLIQSLTSSTCTSLHLPLPYLNNKYLDLPCMTTIYQTHFGAFFTMYQTITYGIIAYWVIVRIFNQVKDFKNPEHDEIEVVDL